VALPGTPDRRVIELSRRFLDLGVDPVVSRSTRQREAGGAGPQMRRRRAMRFLMMSKGDDQSASNPPDEKLQMEMGKFIEELTKAGVLLATGGLGPNGIRIKNSGGKITVTDGPFAEAKETVNGFALVEVRSREEAIELSKRFWQIVGDGEGEIREVFGP
jgi:hypothetical protein